MKPERDFRKQFNLEPSEYGPEDRRQPFLGVNGKNFLILFVLSFPVSAVAMWLVTGQFPYWVKPLLELVASGG